MIDAGEIIRALYNGSGEVDDPKEFVQTYRQLSENFIAESQAVFNLLRDQIDQSSLANDPDVAKRIAMLEELLVKSHKLDEARTAIDKAWELVK